jgi:hypothetical protein
VLTDTAAARLQQVQKDEAERPTHQMSLDHPHAGANGEEEKDEVRQGGDEGPDHTSNPIDRISSIALLLVTTPSRSLKSNNIRPSRSSSWK